MLGAKSKRRMQTLWRVLLMTTQSTVSLHPTQSHVSDIGINVGALSRAPLCHGINSPHFGQITPEMWKRSSPSGILLLSKDTPVSDLFVLITILRFRVSFRILACQRAGHCRSHRSCGGTDTGQWSDTTPGSLRLHLGGADVVQRRRCARVGKQCSRPESQSPRLCPCRFLPVAT